MSNKLNIVLFEPEIPENTGNIARTCVGFNATLHLIRPYGFFLDNKKFIRSGLDYWSKLQLVEHDSFDDFIKSINKESNLYFISRYGEHTTNEIKHDFNKETYLIFGKESTGIDKQILKDNVDKTYRIPTSVNVRSLNLSNCVAMLAYDYVKHNDFENLSKIEPHKKRSFVMDKIFDALIIGGGPAGMFAGIYGYQKKLNVCLIEQTSLLGGQPLRFPNKPVYDFPGQLSITAIDLVNKLTDQLCFESQVQIYKNTKITSYIYKDNCFDITLSNGNLVKAKNIIIATGIIPNEIKNLETTDNGRIPVKQNQLTNLDHIYAIGNVCTYIDKPSSMVTACGEASVAIRSIVNQHE